MATTGYDVLSGLKAVPVAKPAPVIVTPSSIAAAQATVGAKELAATRAETAATRAAEPLTNKSVTPPAPADTTAVWVGGTTTGSWKFQTNTVQGPIGGGPGGQPTGPTGPATTGPISTLTAQQQSDRQNAIAALSAQFSAMGLGTDVAAAITAMVQQGYTADTISLIAQDPKSTNPLAIAMQTRFAGNAARVKAGLAPLSPAEYLATERSYRQVLSSAGLPSGFYDQTSDFTKFISQDISPTELKSRVDLASDAVTNADPFYRQSLQQQYGLSTGDMIAHVLDPSVALPILQKQAAAVSFGAEAQRQGLVVNNATAMLYGAQNISQAQAAQGFKTIAEMLPSEQALASRYTPEAAGNQMAALTADVFGGPNAGIAAANLKRLSTMETSAFGGSAGASQQGQSLGIGTQQGVQ